MLEIIKKLEIMTIRESRELMQNLKTETIEEIYCEAIDFPHYKLAISRLKYELENRQKEAKEIDESIKKADYEHCAALEENLTTNDGGYSNE